MTEINQQDHNKAEFVLCTVTWCIIVPLFKYSRELLSFEWRDLKILFLKFEIHQIFTLRSFNLEMQATWYKRKQFKLENQNNPCGMS